MNPERSILHVFLRLAAMVVLVGQLVGCEVDSFFNPSIVGYWEHTPSTIPILERIDAIEQEDDGWGQTSEVTPEDLIPSDLSYRMVPGDFVSIQIFELYTTGTWATQTRRIDAGGFVRVPELGDVQAAGLTPQELEDAITSLLEDTIVEPQVDIVVEEGSAFHYTVYGMVPRPGMYMLRRPDLSILDALANAGGVPITAEKIYVIRQVELSEQVKPSFERGTVPAAPPEEGQEQPVDIEELIERLDEGGANNDVRPGFFARQDEPAIDIEDLEPARGADQPAVDIEEAAGRAGARDRGQWVYVEERGEWVRVPGGEAAEAPVIVPGQPPLYASRIIEIPYDKLSRGESRYNVVVRPRDLIFIEPPEQGFIYIDGQINRPGVYGLPQTGGLTLSRVVAAAGGLGQLAIPERVDLVRVVGDNREAVIRLNLAAIRHKTEPDVLLKSNDHIIIGTSWIATPLAVIRNGFRATYGFGFLLDRNFGNDVFGAPPTSWGYQ